MKMQTSEGHLGGYIVGQAAPGTWCPALWDHLIEEHSIKSVLDIGCGLGHTLQYFRQYGCEVAGVDGSDSAIVDSVMPEHVHKHDFSVAPWAPQASFDLVWSSEFLEHVEERFIGNFLLAFNKAKRFIAVTYALPGQGGHHHVNENTEDYWVDIFRLIDFELDRKLTDTARQLVCAQPSGGKQFKTKGLIFRRANDN